MEQKYGFIYIWRDKKHKRYYLGSHWGTEDDGYICSSSWMKRAYKHRPYDFKRRILKRFIIRSQITNNEHYWLQQIKIEELGKRYYNLKNFRFGHWSENDSSRLSVRQKISKYQTGKLRGPMSEEHKRKIGLSNKGKIRSKEFKENISKRQIGSSGYWLGKKRPEISKAFVGKKLTENHKQKLKKAKNKFFANGGSSWNKGIAMSEDTKDKLRISQRKIVCPYCNKLGGENLMKRYHLNNCKDFR